MKAVWYFFENTLRHKTLMNVESIHESTLTKQQVQENGVITAPG